MPKLQTAQIGASGVLLIQYRLLKYGIESALMTTDAGIDLVVYSPRRNKAVTMQVKTCLKPKPAGGKGKPALDWWLPKTSPSELVGLVNLEADEAWILRHNEFLNRAQQKPGNRLHLYFYIDPSYRTRPGCNAADFEKFKIEHCTPRLFGWP